MTQLAIIGHKTRGKEVIEILEMLGYINLHNYVANCDSFCFYGGKSTNGIYYDWVNDCFADENVTVFTLEEFLEKYPYKIGDKVTVTGLPEYPKIINFMEWFDGDIHYSFDNETWFLPSELILYKEETMEEDSILNQLIEYFKNTPRDVIEKEWHEYDKYNEIGPTVKEYLESINKPKYPKTYNECVNMFNCSVETVNLTTIAALRELIYCRNAYWKIAGEQMGLGKPWEPEYPSEHYIFTIENQGNNIIKNAICDRWRNRLLIFPTEEIRDMFYENFKELIEICKEFL